MTRDELEEAIRRTERVRDIMALVDEYAQAYAVSAYNCGVADEFERWIKPVN